MLKYLLLFMLLALPASANAELMYPAPPLVNPTTIALGTGLTITKMDPAKDYILKCPAVKKVGSTMLMGGHNIVIQGCYVTIPKGDPQQRAFYIADATGTVHVEGVLVDYSGGAQGDAFAINAPLATVQIQRSRVEGVLGSQSLFHGDIVQPWGGVAALKIDTFTGSSFYQGFQLTAMDGKPATGPTRISRTNLSSLGTSTKESGGYLAWLIQGTAHCDVTLPATLSDFWVQPRADRSGASIVWPPVANHPCPSKLTGSTLSFPAQKSIVGTISVGKRPGGDFVPASAVGLAYDPAAAIWAPEPAPVPVPAPALVVPVVAPVATPVACICGGPAVGNIRVCRSAD